MGLRGTWNHTKSVFRTPCAASGDVGLYVETALRAAAPVLFDFLSFGCREPLKHAAGRGQLADWFGRDNVRGFPRPHRRPKIPGGRGVPATVVAGTNLFWAMDALFERALFYWFLAELGQEFFVNWTSLMYAELGCAQRPAGSCVFKITDQLIGPNPTEMLLAEEPDCHGVLSDIRAVYIPAGTQASIGYHVNSAPWSVDPRPGCVLTSRLQSSDDGKAWGGSEWKADGSTGNGLAGHSHGISGGTGTFRRVSVVASTNGPIAWCTKGQLHVALSGHKVPLIPLADCFKKPLFVR